MRMPGAVPGVSGGGSVEGPASPAVRPPSFTGVSMSFFFSLARSGYGGW